MRAAGGARVGFGHLARCLALTQAWVDTGRSAVLASHDAPQWWMERYTAEGVPLVSPDDCEVGADDWVVLDGYEFTVEDQRDWMTKGAKVLVIDDHGYVGRYEAHTVLDGNLGASSEVYRNRSSDTELLLGSSYTLLRREFRRARVASESSATPASASKLLVTIGGARRPDVRELINAALREPSLEDLDVEWLESVVDVPAAMTRADLALSAAGSTSWELCCLGVPSIVFAIAENQLNVASALVAAHAAVSLGELGNTTSSKIALAVAEVAGSFEQRRRLRETGQSTIDGRGAARVVARLRARNVGWRRAAVGDRELLYAWVNDPVTRAASFNTAPVGWDEHVRWFVSHVDSETCRMYVVEDRDGRPVGQVRFDIADVDAAVDITVAPERRGEGWSPVIIAAGTRALFDETPNVRQAVASIRAENRPSVSAFDTAGYQCIGVDGARDTVRYAHSRDDLD